MTVQELASLNRSGRNTIRKRPLDFAIVVAILILAGTAGWVFRNYAHDDAFITYRYSRNIATGNGFVYNRGEQVLGTSTPLYTLLLATGHWLTGIQIHKLSNLVGVVSLAAASYLLYWMGRDVHLRLSIVAAFLFVTNPILLASLGMETLLLIFTLMSALAAYTTGRRLLTGFLLGALILFRYEMVIFAGLIGFDYWFRERKLPSWLRPGMVFVSVWLIYAWVEFGQLIPQSAIAKLSDQRVPFLLGGLVIWYIYAHQLPGYYLLTILAGLGTYSVIRTRTAGLPRGYHLLLAWGAIYAVVAAIFAGSFPWYYAPLIPGLTILAGIGTSILIDIISGVIQFVLRDYRDAISRFENIILVVAISGMVSLNSAAWMRAWIASPAEVIDARVQTYQEFAKWLNRHANPKDTIALIEVGAIGYYTDLNIVDLSGLMTTEILPLLRTTDRARRLELAIVRYQPEYILVPIDLVQGVSTSDAIIELVYSIEGLGLYSIQY